MTQWARHQGGIQGRRRRSLLLPLVLITLASSLAFLASTRLNLLVCSSSARGFSAPALFKAPRPRHTAAFAPAAAPGAEPTSHRGRIGVSQGAAKKISYGGAAQQKLASGIDAVADAVKVTLGPNGRNVVLQREFGAPQIINDGVTIARAISLADREMDLGARLLTQASSKSDTSAGDGTTTTALLTQHMVNQGIQFVVNGHNPMLMSKGIHAAASRVASEIRRLASPVGSNDLLDIATVSVGGDPIMGGHISQAFEKVGASGNIVIEDSQVLVDSMEATEGFTLNSGNLSPYFVTDGVRQVSELQRPRVLVTDRTISDAYELVGFLEEVLKAKAPLLIIAEDVIGEAMQMLVLNAQRGVMQVAALKAPGFGDQKRAVLGDIALATGAQFVTADLGMRLADVSLAQLGTCEQAVVERGRTIVVSDGNHAHQVKEKIIHLESEILQASSEFVRSQLRDRVASLGGGVAKLKVGGATETEVNDKKLRYNDALNAVRSANELGIVPGGGSVLAYFARGDLQEELKRDCSSPDEKAGIDVVFNSLLAPMRQIALNAGDDPSEVLYKTRGGGFGYGYNAATGAHEDLRAAGVIDPAKVVINSVVNAASIAAMVLTTDAVVTELPSKAPPPATMGAGLGGVESGMGF